MILFHLVRYSSVGSRYGLKYQGICPEDWQRPFLIHVGTGDKEKSLRIARETLAQWATL